jgi:hypothetical protein
MFTIDQGIIIEYTEPRVCSVLQIPDNYVMSQVRLPHTLHNQLKPLPRSVVLVASEDAYKSYIVAVLRDPEGFLETGIGIRGATVDTENFLLPGEIYIEAAGAVNANEGVSGTGGALYLGNDGTVVISSGKRKESIVIGGEDTDDDGELIVTADNGFFESNINPLTQIRSTYRFDINNNLVLGNFLTTVPPVGPIVEIPVSRLTMSTLGQIVLGNFAAGAPVNTITLTPTGTLSLEALATLTVESAVSMTLDSASINLNSGTFGVARLNDMTLADPSTDPAYWQFWTTQNAVFTALPVATDPGSTTALANAIKAALITFTALYPLSITGRISSASTTVKAGG